MKYWAFLSYSHRDKQWAKWLHRALETYRVPRKLVGRPSRTGTVPPRLFPIFRDQEELPVSSDLSSNITEALAQSHYLIVICSPASAQSRWVTEEILNFKRLGGESRILAMIVAGEPNASDGKPGIDPKEECFPLPLRYQLGPDGALGSARIEPIAADVRPAADGKENARLKLLAGLLGVDFDELRQRDQQRQRRRRHIIAATSGVLFAAFASIAVWGISASNRARSERVMSDVVRAEQLFQENNGAAAVLYLARATDMERTSHGLAATRLWFALTQRAWPIAISKEMRHGDALTSACFNPNGSLVLTASRDKTARLWDAGSGEPIGAIMQHPRLVRRAIFSPDGRFIVSIGFDGRARLWDAISGQPLPQWKIEHEDSINSVAISPGGRWIATGSSDGVLRISEFSTGNAVNEAREPENIHTLLFSPTDDNILVSISGDAATEWRLPELTRLFDFDHTAQVNAADFSPNGKQVITAGDDRCCRLWDAASGSAVGIEWKHDAEVRNVFFSPNGRIVATIAGDRVTAWNAAGELKHVLTLDARATAARFTSDSQRIYTGSNSGLVQAWNVENGERSGEPIREEDGIFGLGLDQGGARVLVAMANGCCRVWRAPSRNPPVRQLECPANVDSLNISANEQRLLVTCDDGSARIWSLPDGKPVVESIPHRSAVLSGALSSDGQLAVTGNADGTATLSSFTGGQLKQHDLPRQAAAISQVQFSHDSKSFVTVTDAGVAQFWDAAAKQPIGRAMEHHAPVRQTGFSRDDRLFYTAGSSPVIELWRVPTGDPENANIGMPKEVTATCFSSTRDFIATGDAAGTVRVWSALGHFSQRHELTAGGSAVTCVIFEPNGQRLAAASGNTALAWNTSERHPTGRPVHASSAITCLVFDRDAGRLASGAEDGSVRVWDGFSGQPLTENLEGKAPVRDLLFCEHGNVLLAGSRSSAVRAFDLFTGLAASDGRPLAEFARAISPLHLSGSDHLEHRDITNLAILRAETRTLSGATRILADWFLAEPTERRLTPHARQDLPHDP